MRDLLQGRFDIATVRPALEAGRAGQLVADPGQQQRVHVVDLLSPGLRQPHLVAVALHVAGGDQAGEGGFEDLERYPQRVADIAEPRRPVHLPEAVDAHNTPQSRHVEAAVGSHGDAAQPHPGVAAQHARDRVLQQAFWGVGGRHAEPVAEIDCTVVDIAQRHLAQEQRQHETEQRDRRRAQEHLGQGLGVGRHDGRRYVSAAAGAALRETRPRTAARRWWPAPDQSGL